MGIEWPKLFDTIALMQLAFSLRPLRSLRLKHQSLLESFSVDWGDAFYTIYTAIMCVGPRNDYLRARAETGAVDLPRPPALLWLWLWLSRSCRITNEGWLCRNRSWIRHEGWLCCGCGWVMVGEWLLSEVGILACVFLGASKFFLNSPLARCG